MNTTLPEWDRLAASLFDGAPLPARLASYEQERRDRLARWRDYHEQQAEIARLTAREYSHRDQARALQREGDHAAANEQQLAADALSALSRDMRFSSRPPDSGSDPTR